MTPRSAIRNFPGIALRRSLALALGGLLALSALSCQTSGGRPAEAPGYPEDSEAAAPAADELSGDVDMSAPSRAALLASFEGPTPAINLTGSVLASLDPEQRFALGLDRLVRDEFAPLHFKRVTVFTSRLALDSHGRHLLETLLADERPVVRRAVLFDDELPEPARSQRVDRALAGRPSVRLFVRNPQNFELTDSMFGDAEVVLIDLPLRPGSFQPEANFLANVLEQSLLRGLDVMVLDRPTGDRLFDGPVAPPEPTPHAWFPTPAFHGLTPGEMVRYYNQFLGAEHGIEVMEISQWSAADGFAPYFERLEARGANPARELPEWERYYAAAPEALLAGALFDLLPEALQDRSALDGASLRIVGVDAQALTQALGDSGLSASADGEDAVVTVDDAARPARAAALLLGALLAQAPDAFDESWEVGVGAGFAPEQLSGPGGAAAFASRWDRSAAWQQLLERRNRILVYP